MDLSRRVVGADTPIAEADLKYPYGGTVLSFDLPFASLIL